MVTLVVTSCDRHDLLYKTLQSFAEQNTYPITKTIIVEDSNKPRPLALCFSTATGQPFDGKLGEIVWINTGGKGQIYAIDRAYSEVKTEFIFHCEDDWQFIRPGFIEKSMALLNAFPHVAQVNLRGEDCNGHPLKNVDGLLIQEPYWCGGWGGINFNPGLRRLADYKKLGSLGRHLGYGTHGFEGELALSRKQLDAGYRIASLPEIYVVHTGEGRSQASDATKRPKPLKVLIAIPACHKYTYGQHADGRVHKDQVTNVRVESVRATWAKYLPPFTNVDLKFFFGRQPATQETRKPLVDEVFLNVADDYTSLPHKVQAIFKYALDHGYDYVFKGDDDTFIYVDRLMASGFEQHDYTGFVSADAKGWDSGGYCSGGSGYWVSRKAMQFVAAAPVDDWAEDRWVGRTLQMHGIKYVRDPRYLPGFWEHFVNVDAIGEDHAYITMHACTPPMMQKLFSKTLTPNFTRITKAFHEDSAPTAQPRPQPSNTAVEGFAVKAKLKYAADTLTIDWWDTHVRPE